LAEFTIPELYPEGIKLGHVVLNAGYPPNFILRGDEPLVQVHVPGALLKYSGTTTPVAYELHNDPGASIVRR
ncbi:MAG: hypothetical protein ACOC9B_00760, partial [Chloroflexota bacterium]